MELHSYEDTMGTSKITKHNTLLTKCNKVQQSTTRNQTRHEASTMRTHRPIPNFRSSDAKHRRVVSLMQKESKGNKVITKIRQLLTKENESKVI